MDDFKKILILRLSAIGDTIHTLPLANALKEKYPECQIGWVVEEKAALFIKDNPIVDKCYVLPKKQWKRKLAIIKEINNENYDIVLDTQQLLKSAIILPFLNIKRKITLTGGREFSWLFSNEFIKAQKPLFDFNYHVVNRNLEFANHLGISNPQIKFTLKQPKPETQEKVKKLLSKIDLNKSTVTISPATTWENKHWDENCWTEVVKYLKDKTNLVFTGMECDKPLIQRIINAADYNNAIVLAGETNLEELAQVFRQSDVVIAPDSGSAHIAWAVSKPYLLTIFTATAANRNAPFGDKCFTFFPKIDCYPCMKRLCKRKNKKNICRKSINPQDIINTLKNILHYD